MMSYRGRQRCGNLYSRLRWRGCSGRHANGHLHRCHNVIVNFRDVTALAFVLTSIGLEQAGHEVLTVALVVNLAVGDDIPGNRSDCVGDRTLGLNGLEREGGDPGERSQNEQEHEGRVFITHLILSPNSVDDLDGIRSVTTDGIEVVTKSDTANDV